MISRTVAAFILLTLPLAAQIKPTAAGIGEAEALKVEDRIVLHLDGSGRIREAIDAHRAWIAGEVLASELTVGHGVPFTPLHREDGEIDGEPVAISLSRA